MPKHNMMQSPYLSSARKQFEYYKLLAEKTMQQLSDEQLCWQYDAESNSIETIVKHLWGNMMSRWTDFMHSDGEKEWRQRDAEFEPEHPDRAALMAKWDEGWNCLFAALDSLTESDLQLIVYIRNMGQTVQDAINRQLAHYPYHVGQIVFIGKMMAGENWQSLSIPRGGSQQYNSDKFAQPKRVEHFVDGVLKEKG
jgi:hypothetical protein